MSNAIAFHGRLTKDCWKGATQAGKAMVRFTVAEDVGYGDNKHTNFHEVVLFGKRAEGGLPQYLTKGQAVFVSGELKINKPREHNGSYYNDITVFPRDIDLLGGRAQSGNDSAQSGNGGGGSEHKPETDFSDDIPFITRDGIL